MLASSPVDAAIHHPTPGPEPSIDTPRLLFDLSTLARWHGPPVGIPRCQMKYADYARRCVPETVFTLFDPRIARYRPLHPEAAASIIAGRMNIDFSMMRDATWTRMRTIDSVPAALRPAYWWITRFRTKLLAALEARRLAAKPPSARARLARWQDRLITAKVRNQYRLQSGEPIDRPHLDDVVGPPVTLTPADTTLAVQTDWSHTSIHEIARVKAAAGSRHVVMCHDIIPILFPDWYTPRDASLFQIYFDKALEVADRVIFTSRRSRDDAYEHCSSIGVTIRDSRIVPLGTDVVAGGTRSSASLPQGLSSDRYVLYVSTIEPRKNHRMLISAWKRLLACGIVQPAGYRLVFVGRPGWKMGSFLDEIDADPELAGSVVHLQGIADDALAALYRDAGFCVYPPLYEGFGLPPVEALASGKAVIASNAGPIGDIVGDFGICLDPNDVDAWTEQMAAWITDPAAKDAYARRAQAEYRPVSWDESARRFLEAVLDRTPTPQL